MVATGMFPLSSSKQTVGIVGGTFIAGMFAAYVTWKWRRTRGRVTMVA
jgi:hypothetical protein